MIKLPKKRTESGLAYHVAGSGPYLLLIHGVGLCAESWHLQIPALAGSYKVVSVDLPGHGNSQRWESDAVRLENFVDSLVRFILLEGPIAASKSFSVCGHSLGAILALHLAARLPELVDACIGLNIVHNRTVKALQAVQSRAKSIEQSPKRVSHAQTLVRWFGTPNSAELVKQQQLCDFWLNSIALDQYALAYRAFAEFSGFEQALIEGIVCRALFCTGSHDPNSTPAMSLDLARAMDNAIAVIVPNAKHMMQLTHAEYLNQEIKKFLLTKRTA